MTYIGTPSVTIDELRKIVRRSEIVELLGMTPSNLMCDVAVEYIDSPSRTATLPVMDGENLILIYEYAKLRS